LLLSSADLGGTFSNLRRRGGGKVESVLCFPSAASFPRPSSGRQLQRLVSILLAAGQHSPGHASQLVRDRDHNFVARSTLSQPMHPLRIGEALALCWGAIDLERGILPVTRNVYDGHFDEPKSQRSRRSLPLGAMSIEVLSALKPARAKPDALVFSTDKGTPFDRHNLVNRQLKPTCKRLGLTGVGWHWLRHAHATLLDAVGTPLGTAQALLGHSSSEITREVYLHSIPAGAKAAVQKVEDPVIRPKLTQDVLDWKTASSLIQ